MPTPPRLISPSDAQDRSYLLRCILSDADRLALARRAGAAERRADSYREEIVEVASYRDADPDEVAGLLARWREGRDEAEHLRDDIRSSSEAEAALAALDASPDAGPHPASAPAADVAIETPLGGGGDTAEAAR